MALVPLVGSLASGALNILGGNSAADDLRAANDKAKSAITAGYGEAKGYQQPIYDTALGAYKNLNDRYQAGGFSNPHMDPFKFDPNSVFQDPEYQAQMRAGTEALNSGAEKNGMLFSGTNNRDLTKFGQDTFAGRSDALYKRGFDATNKAFDQNSTSNVNNFNMGYSLMNPLSGSAGQLTSLSLGQGEDLASLAQERGAINAGETANQFGQLGGMTSLLGDSLNGLLPQGMAGKMSPLNGSMFTPRSALS